MNDAQGNRPPLERRQPVGQANGIEYFGATLIEENPEDTLRILGYNLGDFNAHGSGTKYERLNEQMNKYNADISCITETGLAWQNVAIQHRLPEVTKHWWKNRRVFTAWNKGYLKKSDTSTRLPGGVAIILRNEVAGRVHSNGRDPTGLGRWV